MFNQITLIGNVGQDPEVRRIGADETPVANFSLATSERWKDREGNQMESTEWHNIVAWRRLAEIVESYIHKGSKLFVQGKVKTRSWEDEAGNTKYRTEVYADIIKMVGGKSEGSTAREEQQLAAAEPAAAPVTDFTGEEPPDDLPF